MEVRKAELEESNILSEIALRSKAHWGYDDRFIEACRDDLTISDQYISSNIVYVIEDAARIIGFFSLVAKAKKSVLDAFFIDPMFIRQGYGRIL